MDLEEQLNKSKFLKYKAQREWANPNPPYDKSKDPAVLADRRSIEADYQDDDWWEQFYKDKGRHSSIFKSEERDEAKEGEK